MTRLQVMALLELVLLTENPEINRDVMELLHVAYVKLNRRNSAENKGKTDG